MIYALTFLLLVACFIVSDTLLELKIKKLEKEIIAKESVIAAFATLDKVISKLNTGFKDHERRLNDIEERLPLSRESEKPEYTCKDCKYYHVLSGIGFVNAINFGFSNGINGFKCEKIGCSYPSDCNGICQLFEKKDGLDEDENVVYANNVKVDISSKEPRVYKTDEISEESTYYRIAKLYLDGGISLAGANALLESLKK